MSAESQEPSSEAPESPSTPSVGVSLTERARALLRVRGYRRAWRAQATGTLGDRLALLTLLGLTVLAVVGAQALGGGYSGMLLGIAAAFGARLAGTLLLGAVLLAPLAQLTQRLDRRRLLLGTEALRAGLIGCSVFWVTWIGSKAWIWLLVTVFVSAALERVVTVTRESFVESLLPIAAPGHPPVDQRPVLRHIDLWTSYAAVPYGALALVLLTLLNQGIGQGIAWLAAHPLALAGFGAAALFVAAGVLSFGQELPEAGGGEGVRRFEPRSPLTNLRAPADVTPGLGARGRTGSSLTFSFAACSTVAAVAAAVSVAFVHAFDLLAGEIGYGLLVLALTAGLPLGLRVSRSVLPTLSRRRLLPLAMATSGLALVLGGLVRDYVLALVLFVLAGIAGGVAFRTARALLALETEEARLPRVDEHLHAMLRVSVALALIAGPLIGAAFGPEQFGGTTLTFDHGGAGLAVSVAGLLLVLAGVVTLLRADDRKGVAPLPRDVWDALRGGAQPSAHRAGTGFFIALEGGDGAGKSTQAQALAEWIRSKGHEVVLTREPGGSAVGQRLRAMLLDVGNTGISHRAEALMYAADRAEHVDSVIRPALERGAVVITDRYSDSSVAYQGAGRDLAGAEIARLNRWATDGLVPDLTVLLDVAPSAARERFTEAPDRLESEPEVFHQRVRAGFLALAAADPARYLVVDAGQPPHAVTTAIRHRLDRELPLSEQEKAALAEQERLAREAEARRIEEEARRKAEEERAERERQETLERLRLEAEEAEKARQAEEDRRAAEVARQAAEAARRQAEAEAARRANEEAERRRAEEAAHAAALAEAARLAELERQRAEKRAEERRRAEEALRRAEESRVAAEAAATDPVDSAEAQPGPHEPTTDPAPGHIAADETAVLPLVGEEPDGGNAAGHADAAPHGDGSGDAVEATASTAASDTASDGVAEARTEASAGSSAEATAVMPVVAEAGRGAEVEAEASASSSAEATAVMPVVAEAGRAAEVEAEVKAAEGTDTAGSPLARGRKARAARAQAAKAADPAAPTGSTTPTAPSAPSAPSASAEETMVLPPFPAQPPVVGTPAAEPELPKARRTRTPRKAAAEPTSPKATSPKAISPTATTPMDETTVMPVVPPIDQPPLPRSWREAAPRNAESVQDKVPDWLFRPEPGRPGAEAPTAQIPVVPAAAPDAADTPAAGGRYDWAEETPLDDLPTLTDQLLGTREEWAHWHAEHPEQPGRPDEEGGREPGPGKRS
ncbi:dTMP kinase [Streptacidiphilus sp. MAP12-20]|uniref:dTMP kinase n=1 Tax=Streptacidiphilus sp. MAP12-20 TaxID=3156299 RepID=UPI003517D551